MIKSTSEKAEQLWREQALKEAAAERKRIDMTLNEMFPIKIEKSSEEPAPFKVKKGSVLDGVFDFWYSPTAWELYGHNLMNGIRYTLCVKGGKKPLYKGGFPDLVLVLKGIPWGVLTQDTTTQGYRDDFTEMNWEPYNEIYYRIDYNKKQECLCQYCQEERIRQRVLAKLEELRRRVVLYDRVKDRQAEFDRLWAEFK